MTETENLAPIPQDAMQAARDCCAGFFTDHRELYVADVARAIYDYSRRRHTVEAQPVAWQRRTLSYGWVEVREEDIPHYREAGNEFRALYAAPTAPSRAEVTPEWQPIETAPKNTKVLAAYQNELGNWRIVTACYHTQLEWSDEYGDHEEEFAPEAWYEENDSSEVIYPTSRVPTHWMPLPAGPALGAGKKEGGE